MVNLLEIYLQFCIKFKQFLTSQQVVEQADVVIVATKPPLVPKVLTEINPVQK